MKKLILWSLGGLVVLLALGRGFETGTDNRPAVQHRKSAAAYRDSVEAATGRRLRAESLLARVDLRNVKQLPDWDLKLALSYAAEDGQRALIVQEKQRREAATAAEAESTRLANLWSYSSQQDPMSSRPARHASIQSTNTVSFSFPYEGAQHATLTIRDHPSYGHDVYLTIERGQILCQSYDDCQVRIRFGDAPAETWNAVGPSDNGSTCIFIRNQPLFVRKLRAAKVVRIEVPVYQEGQPVFEFEVGGFSDARYRKGY